MKKLKFELITTLQDGTSVSLDDFSVGGVISIIDTDGNKSVAPDGDYTFEDGSVATVTDGAISAIATAAEEAPEEMATDAPASGATEDNATDTEDTKADEDLSAQIKTLTDAVAKLQATLDSLTADQAEMKKEFAKERELSTAKFNAVSAKSILDKTSPVKVPVPYAEKAMEAIRAFNNAKTK